ncbi:phosphotransferase [Diaporthe helianthi]|uniref:Phosphotransferase n=1 Tax=Diaporthe helianthi TaxID=158607 RepID=A0A2P5HWQ8_DIAHE|nr:phosphotransferase [Diaporthe helianthi]
MMSAREDSDNLAWDRSDELWEEALRQVRLSSQCRKIEAFAEKTFGKPATLVTPLIIGGFNVLYPIRLEGSSDSVLVRLPCPNQAVFPEEKTVAEAATATYVAQHTEVPVPTIFHHGVDPDIGPFMIIQDLESRRGMGQALEAPREDLNETAVLDPDISESKLKDLYFKIARCVLQLAQPTFPRIGSLAETGAGSYSVTGRPITLNMSNMVQLSNIPKSIFPPEGTTYETTDAWYVALAEMQMATLIFQHNDMISSEDDCRNKYVARQIFRRLAKQGRLASFGFAEDDWSARSQVTRSTLSMPDGSGSFRLWADDFRPANIMVDDKDNIIGAIDWEFAYVGPTQFVLDAPWWLLLDVPEMWDQGIEEWASVYEKRLKTWLLAMEQAEEDIRPASLRLSAYMRESWETGRFWLDYAARKSWAFDTIYWKYLDEKFFGPREKDISKNDLWRARVHLLSEEERVVMEPLVQTKMVESKERILVEWDAAEARRRLTSLLFS